MALSQLGIAMPSFWFAILLILLFAVKLHWVSGRRLSGLERSRRRRPVGRRCGALLLPAVALAVVQAAILARWTRSAVLEVLREDFVRTARAKGLSRRAVLWRHVLRNAMIPVLTIMGLQFAILISRHRRRRAGVRAARASAGWCSRPSPTATCVVVRDVVMLLAAMVVVVNFVVDVLYAVIDPRLQGQRRMSGRAMSVGDRGRGAAAHFAARALRHPSFADRRACCRCCC